MKDLDKLALALPETEKELEEGRATYHVGGKYFCFQRRARRDAVDAETGERLADVLRQGAYRVPLKSRNRPP